MDEEIVECSICGEKFDIEYEGSSIDTHFFCSYCESEYTFWCPNCDEQELEENRGNIGSMLIVNNVKEAGIARGIWEITSHPYFYGSCLGMDGFIKSALKYIGPLRKNQKINTGDYACGHVCHYCDSIIKAKAIANKSSKKNNV